MAVSAETFFHFTSTKETLQSIFSNGFWLRYSLENYEGILDKVKNATDEDNEKEILIPMICFCDLPLMQVKEHISHYGSYAIGLSRDWGFEKKLSPVIYTHANSDTSSLLNHVQNKLSYFFDLEEKLLEEDPSFRKLIEYQLNESSLSKKFDGLSEVVDHVSHLVRFIKPYSGEFRDKGIKKFYDEREWRFVPIKNELSGKNLKDSYGSSFYHNPIKRRWLRIQTHNKFSLTFEPKDVRFIILKYESEIPDFIKFIKDLYYQNRNCSQSDIDILTTRILTIEHINNDF